MGGSIAHYAERVKGFANRADSLIHRWFDGARLGNTKRRVTLFMCPPVLCQNRADQPPYPQMHIKRIARWVHHLHPATLSRVRRSRVQHPFAFDIPLDTFPEVGTLNSLTHREDDAFVVGRFAIQPIFPNSIDYATKLAVWFKHVVIRAVSFVPHAPRPLFTLPGHVPRTSSRCPRPIAFGCDIAQTEDVARFSPRSPGLRQAPRTGCRHTSDCTTQTLPGLPYLPHLSG